MCPDGGAQGVLSSSCFLIGQAASEGRVLRERRVQVDVVNQDGGSVEEKKATVSWPELLKKPCGSWAPGGILELKDRCAILIPNCKTMLLQQ